VEETFPDVASMSDQELKAKIDSLKDEERSVSYRRRLLHGQIDLLRAELVNRLKNKVSGGDAHISGADVDSLTDILLGKVEHPEET
jgi:anti-sigma-K factor RsiG